MNTRNTKTKTDEAAPKWTSTSAKRKRTYTNTIANATPAPPAKVTKKEEKAEKEETPSFNWAERRSQVEEFPNADWIYGKIEAITQLFVELAKEFRKNSCEVGPSMLWHMLPAVMDALQNTPWAYHVSRTGEYMDVLPCYMFINYTYGDRGQELSINQNKFRKVILSRLKVVLTEYLNTCFEFEVIVIFSKKFFDSI